MAAVGDPSRHDIDVFTRSHITLFSGFLLDCARVVPQRLYMVFQFVVFLLQLPDLDLEPLRFSAFFCWYTIHPFGL